MKRWIVTLVLIASILPTSMAQAGNCGATITVQRGDTLTRIATRCGVTVDALVQANSLSNPNIIRIGQALRIPSATTLIAIADLREYNSDDPCQVAVYDSDHLGAEQAMADALKAHPECQYIAGWEFTSTQDLPEPLPFTEETIRFCSYDNLAQMMHKQGLMVNFDTAYAFGEALGCPMMFDE